MPVRQATDATLPAVISVSAMAKKCGLSRSRFYELVAAGIFPPPVYDLRTRRPMFLLEQQVECLRVRTTSVGSNGQYILFYAPRQRSATTRTPGVTTETGSSAAVDRDLVQGLRALGMASVTSQEVEAALRSCYPQGREGRDEGEVLRACWQFLRSSDRGE